MREEQMICSQTQVPLGAFVSGRPLHLGFEAPCYDTGLFSLPRAVPRIL